jgi:argininosuccinate lyase
MKLQRPGRLSRPPHPVLFELLYEPHFLEQRRHALPELLRIDAAHVVMLAEAALLPLAVAAELLAENRELAARSEAGEPVLAPPASHRGLYLVYERHLIDRLGAKVGGAAHLARSRNDLNAAITRMRLRRELIDLLNDDLALLGTTAALAAAQRDTLMCSFTHLQPAQPSSFGHYLTAVLCELTRSAEWLAGSLGLVNASPLGAAAGAGTSLHIDRGQVARLLGFRRVLANAADAVASRDYAVHVLAGLAMAGTTLSRLAVDLQGWASHAYGFLGWPDDLVSTSSIMPQKRNAFVLENIRGQAVQAAGALVCSLTGLKNTPFGNSVEVSSEVTAHLWPALAATSRALRLMRLLLAEVVVHRERMRAFTATGQVTMSALADLLATRHQLPFRTAHEAVAHLAQELGEGAMPAAGVVLPRLQRILATLCSPPPALEEAELAAALDPDTCMRAARYGGGPAPAAVQEQLRALGRRRRRLRARVQGAQEMLRLADRRLAAAVAAVRGRQRAAG